MNSHAFQIHFMFQHKLVYIWLYVVYYSCIINYIQNILHTTFLSFPNEYVSQLSKIAKVELELECIPAHVLFSQGLYTQQLHPLLHCPARE